MITIQTDSILLELIEGLFDGQTCTSDVFYDQVLECFRVFVISANITADFDTFEEAYAYVLWLDDVNYNYELFLN